MSRAYYNEIDSYAAQWLRNLITQRLIAEGDVDERDIRDVKPRDLAGYDQCHFFAGIGGWSYALRLAAWPADRKVWTGSCPCQPFSAAGKGNGFADERHLWPYWFWLITQCKPAIVLGEQVASKAGLEWFDLVQADMEAAGYAVGAADLCAAGVGAPHIRQRLWFVADTQQRGLSSGRQRSPASEASKSAANGWSRCELADASRTGLPERERDGRVQREAMESPAGQATIGQSNPWHPADWLPCTDGKARPTQPSLFPLVDGLSFKLGSGSAFEGKSRVGMLRAAGNAIVSSVAAEFIKAIMQC